MTAIEHLQGYLPPPFATMLDKAHARATWLGTVKQKFKSLGRLRSRGGGCPFVRISDSRTVPATNQIGGEERTPRHLSACNLALHVSPETVDSGQRKVRNSDESNQTVRKCRTIGFLGGYLFDQYLGRSLSPAYFSREDYDLEDGRLSVPVFPLQSYACESPGPNTSAFSATWSARELSYRITMTRYPSDLAPIFGPVIM